MSREELDIHFGLHESWNPDFEPRRTGGKMEFA